MSSQGLYDALAAYLKTGRYPLHMPGGKRRAQEALPASSPLREVFAQLPYGLDFTELQETDNLHDAQGILRDAMERTAALCGVGRTFYLVGGSTAGILAGMHALVPFGAKILCARNCHRAVYHAAELLHLDVVWLTPTFLPDFGVAGSLSPETVRAALEAHPDAAALVLTSPTYEGIVSAIRAIADLCRAAGTKLFVDEAHGAHLGLFEKDFFPDSACHLGADLVVQSAHKTLPALTQTAFLHVPAAGGPGGASGGSHGSCSDGSGSDDVISDARRLAEAAARSLTVFETSSPSYPLLLSLDACTELLRTEGAALFSRWRGMLEHFYRETAALKHFRILRDAQLQEDPSCFARDPGKILILAPGNSSGAQLAAALRERFSIETEMNCGSCVLAMTSCMDDAATLRRLAEALLVLDAEASRDTSAQDAAASAHARLDAAAHAQYGRNPEPPASPSSFPLPPVKLCDALSAEAENVPAEKAAGRILAEYLCPYPPGIPLLSPGEAIPEALLHHSFFSGLKTVRVLK